MVIVCISVINNNLANQVKEITINNTVIPSNSYEMSSIGEKQISPIPEIEIVGKLTEFVDNNSKDKDFLFFKHNYNFKGTISIDDLIFKYDSDKQLIFSMIKEGVDTYLYASSSVATDRIYYENKQYNAYISIQMTTDLKLAVVQLYLVDNNLVTLKKFSYEF